VKTVGKKTFSAKIVGPASPNSNEGDPEGVNLNNFFSLMNKSGSSYIFSPCRDFWPAKSVNARLPPMPVLTKKGTPKRDANGKIIYQAASQWLDKNRPIELMTWAPGLPLQIQDKLISTGGWIARQGVSCFNLYRPPRIKLGDASKAELWLDHIRLIYPDDFDHIVRWCAQRVQRPDQKINHALVLGGPQGIGKDSLLEPLKEAVGRWNFAEITPEDVFAPFNPFARSVIIRINEARDLGDVNRFKFYDRAKFYIVVPADVLPVNDKYIPRHYVPNVCGVLITTNHKTDGLYLPADDRRHYVAWSDRTKEEFAPAYWNKLWKYYRANDGFEHIAAYLTELDISDFDPMAPPPKTAAWEEIVNVNRAPEDAELADVIDALGKPDPNDPTTTLPPNALTVPDLIASATGDISEWLMNRGNRRAIPHRLARCGYVVAPNPDRRKDGLWKCDGRRQAVYARANLSANERLAAAKEKADKS
jgi:hypothetical protein